MVDMSKHADIRHSINWLPAIAGHCYAPLGQYDGGAPKSDFIVLKGLALRLPIILSAAAFLLAGCDSTNKSIPEGIAALPDEVAARSQMPAQAQYRIGELDELSVIVFREPDLSVERVVVDVAGNVNLPVVGTMPAFGRTVEELSAEIASRLNQRYLRNAEVAVSVTRPTSYVFTVEGQVRKPGTYALPGRVTLLQALAIGEGATERARLSDVIVFRTINGQRYAARFNVKDIRLARADDPQLRAGDTVVVGFSTAKQIYGDIIMALPGVAGIFVALNQN